MPAAFNRGQLFFEVHDLFDLRQEPAVDFRELKHFFHAETGPQCVTQEENELSVGNAELLHDYFAGKDVTIAENPLAKAEPLTLKPSDIDTRQKSPISMMPTGVDEAIDWNRLSLVA